METYKDVKQIIGGVTFNTRTAMFLGSAPGNDKSLLHDSIVTAEVVQVFRTRGGEHFFVYRKTPFRMPMTDDYSLIDYIQPVSNDEVTIWFNRNLPNTIHYPPVTTSPMGESISLRIDSQMKRTLRLRAAQSDGRFGSVNGLCVAYLEYGVKNDITKYPKDADCYKTENGTFLLTNDGEARFDNDDLLVRKRAYAASVCRKLGNYIPNEFRKLLIDILSESKEDQDILLNDLKRWFAFLERASGKDFLKEF